MAGAHHDPGDAWDDGGSEGPGRRAVPELTGVVPAPAPQRAVRGCGAGVVATSRDGRGPGDADDLRRRGRFVRRAVTEFTVAVPPPAAEGAIRQQRACMYEAGRGSDSRRDARDLRRHRPGPAHVRADDAATRN